ncbi:MAG: hypothetical protein ACR2HX_22590 [Pyrinomonadaceae bacterium]
MGDPRLKIRLAVTVVVCPLDVQIQWAVIKAVAVLVYLQNVVDLISARIGG